MLEYNLDKMLYTIPADNHGAEEIERLALFTLKSGLYPLWG